MSKGARIRRMQKEGTDRRHTVVSKQSNPLRMNNPANAIKARALGREKNRPLKAAR